MKPGFLTSCLPRLPLDEIAPWAAGHGYGALEVATCPAANRSRDFDVSHIDVAALGEQRSDEVRELFDEHGLPESPGFAELRRISRDFPHFEDFQEASLRWPHP